MKSFKRYKVNASDLAELMSREQGNYPPTDKDLEEFLRILEKDSIDITIPQEQKLQQHVLKTVNYDNYSLSGAIKAALYKHYCYARFGVGKVSATSKIPLQLEKGEVAEPSAIELLSRVDSVQYEKNEKLYENKYFKGIPDIILRENDKIIGVKDIKISLDLPSFLERVDGDSVNQDRWEMLAYLDILDVKEGELCYCLVDMPKHVRVARLKEHEDRLTLLGFTPDHIKKRLKQIEKSMIYDYIPDIQKVKRFKVTRKGYFTKQAHDRVRLIRLRLQNLHQKFENPLILPETAELLPDSTD